MIIGWHHWLNGHDYEQTLGDGEGQGSLACCSPQAHKELDIATEQQQMMSWEWHFTSVVFPGIHNPSLITRKNIRNLLIEEYSTKYLTSTLQTVKVFRTKESLRNCHSQEEAGETGWLNIGGIQAGTEQKKGIKTKED